MSSLAAQRCLNHERREAACRCPQCQNYFCRECVAPFQERMLCGACLSKISSTDPASHRTFSLTGVLIAAAGFLIVWLLFCFAGWAILQLRDHAPEVEGRGNVLEFAA